MMGLGSVCMLLANKKPETVGNQLFIVVVVNSSTRCNILFMAQHISFGRCGNRSISSRGRLLGSRIQQCLTVRLITVLYCTMP